MVTGVNTISFPNTNAPTTAPSAVSHIFMVTIGDSIDPQGTKRPNEDLLLHCAHTFKPVVVAERPSKPCLPRHVSPMDAYGIFSLFFTNDLLNTIAKNTNSYARQRGAHVPKPPNCTRK